MSVVHRGCPLYSLGRPWKIEPHRSPFLRQLRGIALGLLETETYGKGIINWMSVVWEQ
jgi:hypothetical protein